MSPVPTAIREENGSRPVPVPLFAIDDLFMALAKEMVVDWQIPADMERTR
jgi:hypothetical protein